MTAQFVRRGAHALIVLLSVSVLSFTMFRTLGDPIVSILGANSTAPQRDALRHTLGLDEPLPVQFGDYAWRCLHGDFGISYRMGQPVGHVLLERAPATIELAASGMALAVLVGIPAGMYAAINRRRNGAEFLLGASLLGVSMPSFCTGLLLMWIFSLKLGWLSAFGRGDVVKIGWWTTGFLTGSGRRALVMPTLTIAVFQIAVIMRLVRAEMLDVLRADFIRFARARGLSRGAIYLRHALRNTLIPVVTIVGLQLGSVIAFAVITEDIFQWPGLGLLFLQSVEAADVPMLAAYLLLIAGVFVVINFLIDLLYAAIDPRLGANATRVRAT